MTETLRHNVAAAWTPPPWLTMWSPPLRRREFWIVQALVLGIAAVHGLIELARIVDLHGADFLPVSLFLLPVVYAALNFGVRGSAPTAAWSFVLTLPNAYLWHEGAGAIGEIWQATVVVGVGVFVGHWVDRERAARRDAEIRERERRASEERYQGLFHIAADPILVLDPAGTILEANAAAHELMTASADEQQGRREEALRAVVRMALTATGAAADAPLAINGDAGPVWVEPIMVRFHDADGQQRILAQLRNVTPGVERQLLLETFARRTVAAREEERRRVARDLHDGPLQSLMLLSRTLAEGTTALDPMTRRLLHSARSEAEKVASELRRFSRDLRPSILDDLGLAPALKAETAAFECRSGIAATFQFRGRQERLPMEIELTLLRICQEALRNIERHARARKTAVSLERRQHTYRLTVADDGIGLQTPRSPSELVAGGRLGVVGMQERARLVGATCTIGAASGWSTVVDVVGSVEGGDDPPRRGDPVRTRSLGTAK